MENSPILIIDDDIYMRSACAKALRSENYDVTMAEDGEQGLGLLANLSFALVITDLKMPGIDGLEVLKRVKELSPKTDVIVMTAHGSIENAVEAMKNGAYDYLSKNFDLTELKLIVGRCLEKQKLSAEVQQLKEMINLYEVSKAISSLMGIDELLNLILKLVCDTLSAEGGSIMLANPTGNELSVKVAIGPRKDEILGKKIALGERIAGYSAKNEQLVSIQGTLKDDPRFAHLSGFDDYKSSITVPLNRKGKLLGVLNLHRKKSSLKFSGRDEQLLSIFAVEAAIAIENTSLYENLAQEKEALAREKDELNATFENMADGSITTDNKLKIVRLNNSAEELLGISATESAGTYLPANLPDFESSLVWDDIENQPARTFSFELSRKKGKTLFLGAVATKIFNNDEKLIGYILVLRNITEEKREGKHKMDFLSIISHKLKTPLTSINGFSSFLATKLKNSVDEQVLNALRTINNQGSLLNELVESLIRFTLLESEYTHINKEKTSAVKMLKICLDGISSLALNYNAEIHLDPGVDKLPPVFIDHVKIVEVVQNLIENGLKFNKSEKKFIKISAKVLDNDFALFEVSDNGLGIPSEEQNKIFQIFYQIDEYYTGQIRGAGLGLALVKRIIELHGGKVWVKSKIGEGSTFFFTLPLSAKEDPVKESDKS